MANYGLQFLGGDSRVVFPSTPDLFTSKDFTIELRFQTTDATVRQSLMLCRDNVDFAIEVFSGAVRFTRYVSGHSYITTSPISNDVTYTVKVVFTPTGRSIYLDGVLQDSDSETSLGTTATGEFASGYNTGVSKYQVLGFIDYITVVNNTDPTKSRDYQFDEGTGVNIADKLGTGSTDGVYQSAPALDAQWVLLGSVETDVSRDLALPYNVSDDISSSLEVKYNLVGTAYDVFKPLILPHSIASDVSADLSVLYSTSNGISNSLEVTYSTSNSVSGSLEATYDVANDVSRTLEIQYNISSTISDVFKPLTLTYNTVGEVGSNLSVQFSTASGISSGLTVGYDVSNDISKQLGVWYGILNDISKQLEVSYSIINGVSRQLEVISNTANYVGSSLTVAHHIAGDVSSVLGVLWGVNAVQDTSISLNLKWEVIAAPTLDVGTVNPNNIAVLPARYKVAELPAKHKVIKWLS